MVASKKVFPLKALKPSQFAELDRGFNLVFKEYLPRFIHLNRDFAPSYVPENLSNTCVALDGKKVAAHASGKTYGVRCGAANFVWASYGNVMTLPEYRGQGIATRINARLWGKMKREGVDGVYISGGRGLYTRVGATPSGAYVDHLIRRKAPVKDLRIRRCGPSDLNLLLSLQDAEKNAFTRKEKDFRSVLSDGVMYLNQASAWLISSKSGPLAWAVLGPAGKKKNKKRPFTASLHDYAGSRAALIAGLDLLMKRLGYKETEMQVAGGDKEFLWMLEQRGSKGHFHGVDGTHLILDPLRLMKRLRPLFSEAPRLQRKGQGFEFSLGSARYGVKDLPALTRLILGEDPKTRDRKLPKKGKLATELRRAFPLTFPVIGLNWT